MVSELGEIRDRHSRRDTRSREPRCDAVLGGYRENDEEEDEEEEVEDEELEDARELRGDVEVRRDVEEDAAETVLLMRFIFIFMFFKFF